MKALVLLSLTKMFSGCSKICKQGCFGYSRWGKRAHMERLYCFYGVVADTVANFFNGMFIETIQYKPS
jgi:hypothetical protein